MASVAHDKATGTRRVLFNNGNGKRCTIYMGKVSDKVATAMRVRIEALLAATSVKHAPDEETARWLLKLEDVMHAKLSALGLVPARKASNLKPWLDTWMLRKAGELKPESMRKLKQTADKLVLFFGEATHLREITTARAFEWEAALGVSEASRKIHVGNAKGMFADVVRDKIIMDNPFERLKSGATPASDVRYVTPAECRAILDACADWRYRLVFGLARYAGLRIRSEGFGLLWRDVDWDKCRINVRSPKTERYAGHESRIVPITPDLAPILREALEHAEDGATHVVPLKWTGGVPEKMLAVIYVAGVKPWKALFQTLRSSCEIQWAMTYPQFAVSKWIGHSIAISGRHYANIVPDELYESATGEATRQATQQASESVGSSVEIREGNGRDASRNSIACRALPNGAGCEEMGDEGLEPLSTSPESQQTGQIAKSATQNTTHTLLNQINSSVFLSKHTRAALCRIIRADPSYLPRPGGAK